MVYHFPIRISILILCFVFCLRNAFAQDFTYSSNCQKAYQAFLSMKIDEGKIHLKKEIQQNPKNLLPFILINYEDFVSLSFNENMTAYKQQKPLFEKRLKLIETGAKTSPYYLFSKGLLYFQWCVIRIKHNDYWDAAWDFRKAFLLFKENQVKFPNFKPNQIFIGTQEAIMSTIPNGYKWVSSLLGLKGNMNNGMTLLKEYAISNEPQFRDEAQFYYVYLKNYLENDPNGASKFIADAKMDIVQNQLFAFMASNLALNNKKAKVAESILEQRSKGNQYVDFPMLDYEMACAKLRQLNFDADNYFLKFIKNYKGHFYIKDAYYHLAISKYLQGKTQEANSYITILKKSGKTESDADKQAQKFAVKNSFPNKELLKARLLNDGGDNEQALDYLIVFEKRENITAAEKLEYHYRLARICDDLEQDEKAVLHYKITIELGKNSTEYYAARAALQTAYIFEQKNMKKEAIVYFEKVLDMDNHEYKNSIDQRAKSGINRLKGK